MNIHIALTWSQLNLTNFSAAGPCGTSAVASKRYSLEEGSSICSVAIFTKKTTTAYDWDKICLLYIFNAAMSWLRIQVVSLLYIVTFAHSEIHVYEFLHMCMQ